MPALLDFLYGEGALPTVLGIRGVEGKGAEVNLVVDASAPLPGGAEELLGVRLRKNIAAIFVDLSVYQGQ